MNIYILLYYYTIKGGSRRAEKSRKALMMMKAAKLGWAGSGAGQEQTMSRPGEKLSHFSKFMNVY